MQGRHVDATGDYPASEYWNVVLGDRYDLRGTGYPELPLSWNEWLYRQMRSSVDRMIKRNHLAAGLAQADVLDIGSGVGHWLVYWRKHGVQSLRGCDLTETAVGQLNARFPDVPVTQVDIGAPNPPIDGTFDLISVMAVLQHITNDDKWRQALSNVSSLLAADGSALIIDPLVTHNFWTDEKPAGAMSWLRRADEWKAALADAGLVIVDLIPTTFTLAAGGDAARGKVGAAWHRYWDTVHKVNGRREGVGKVTGAMAFGLDQVLTRSPINGVSTKTILVKHAR